MDDSEDNMSAEDSMMDNNILSVKVKSKKRSLVERELETTLTARITSPVTNGESSSMSRYGRARKLKTDTDFCDTDKVVMKVLKSPQFEKTPVKSPSSPAYKMHASNSPVNTESQTRAAAESNLENQIENIYNANISLSRFGSEEKNTALLSPAKKFSKVYIRKDLIQTKEKEKEETMTLIKNMFSPINSNKKKTNSHLSNILERSSEKYNLNENVSKPQNGYLDTSSVVKTLDFDGNKKKKKDVRETKNTFSKNELFELEAKCSYQVGDVAWARMGTYPFWPCIITREPVSEMFVKKKLFGKIERDMIHVTFFGDNGRRSWILDSMLRRFLGLAEFETAREQFTPEAKKKDPRLYAAFFISDKKLALWHASVEEAEAIQKEPKRLRIDIFVDLLEKSRIKVPKAQKSGKITRTNSDVSLSESLYDSLFSEDDTKNEDPDRTKNKNRNKSLDVSDVVTACLDNMAAKTGLTQIQRQSHMDRWLQKAKSKTPEKSFLSVNVTIDKVDEDSNEKVKAQEKDGNRSKRRKTLPREAITKKPYSLRRSTAESQNLLSHHNEHDYSKNTNTTDNYTANLNDIDVPQIPVNTNDDIICVIDKVESLCNVENEHTKRSDTSSSKLQDECITDPEILPQIISNNDTVSHDIQDQSQSIKSLENEDNSSKKNNEKLTEEVMDTSSSEIMLKPSDVDNSKENNDTMAEKIDSSTEVLSDKNALPDVNMTIDTDNVILELDSLNSNAMLQQSEEQNSLDNETTSKIDQEDVTESVDNISVDENFASCNNSVLQSKLTEEESSIEPLNIEPNDRNINMEDTSLQSSEIINFDLGKEVKYSEINENPETLPRDQDKVYVDSSIDIFLEVREKVEGGKVQRVDAAELKAIIENKLPTVDSVDNTCLILAEIDESVSSNFNSTEAQLFSNKKKLGEDVKESFESLNKKDFTDSEQNKTTIDPETVSIISVSSEKSNSSELLPRIMTVASLSESNNVKDDELQKIKAQLLFDSDNESMSSMDDITLSELKRRSTSREKSEPNLSNNDETMDSVISNTSANKKLRIVLTDCIVQTNDSKLPLIKDVTSKTHEEVEITGAKSPEAVTKKRKLRLRKSISPSMPKVNGVHDSKEVSPEPELKEEIEPDTISITSTDSGASTKRKGRKQVTEAMKEPEFLQYVELRQDAVMDEHPELTEEEIVAYLYKTWQYEESMKSDIKKSDDLEQSNLVKGVNVNQEPPKKRKPIFKKRIIDIDKIMSKDHKKISTHILGTSIEDVKPRDMPKRKISKPLYTEDLSDMEDEIELFEIFTKKKMAPKKESQSQTIKDADIISINSEESGIKVPAEVPNLDVNMDTKEALEIKSEDYEGYYDEEELYFEQLTQPKPNIFRGLVREKVCEICEQTSNLVKCKGCNSMFHTECVNKVVEVVEVAPPTRGRKKKKKPRGRKPKVSTESNGDESQSDEKSQDVNVSEENMSIEDIKEPDPIVIPDAESFEAQLSVKMQEMLNTEDNVHYDSYSSDDGLDWSDTVAGKCEIVDIKLKPKTQPMTIDYSEFKCKNCQKYDTPICFVCKSAVSPKGKVEKRQKCQVAHCHKYYHVECLDHWPQTHFTSMEPSRANKKVDEHFEALTCPRHVCHTCVCDDPRGCKTRFSGDKLARCVRCPATYHSFTKCLPAGSQILSASHIVCPRHYEHRPGKVPCHVNTGWCFICALGGTLICCEYCPTSFHADCLNIEPPEGGYMCEDCETGRLPLYGEMVWVKLGHYRWWPGIILHPSEIPDNIMAVKHSPGEFVVRFFGQYDYYWVNRGRVFPFQEGDSGRISGQKSKIDEAFTKAMEHAQRAFEILKNIEPNDEENQDIASSLLPPHYVKLKVNKPCGSLYGRKVDIEESSLTQCECNPDEEDPCGPYSHCLNRMLLTECGPTCRAGERCQNRAFEKRLYPKLVPYRTSHRGWGLKTLEDIKSGQFVIEYVGELIDEEEFRRRMRRKHEIRDENFYFLTLDKERMIDAGPKGNLARFMNHCCEPNCETQKWTVLGDVRVGLFAIHDIPANTEVTFNYNLECAGIEKKQCMCGAKRCSGYMGAKPKQDEPPAKKGKLPAKRTYKKRKNIESPSTSKIKPKRPVGRPAKPRELTEIEKDLLIIKNATNGLSSDSECSGRLSSVDCERKDAKALKRKRVSFSTEEIIIYNGVSSPSVKRVKLDDDVKVSEGSD